MTEQPRSDTVVLQTRDRVRYVTMNRPERRNALNEVWQAALIEAGWTSKPTIDVSLRFG